MTALVMFLGLFLISLLAERTDACEYFLICVFINLISFNIISVIIKIFAAEYYRIKIDGNQLFDVIIKIMFTEKKTIAKWFHIQFFLFFILQPCRTYKN